MAATGSFLKARQQQGTWLVRIEDLDIPRTVAGAADAILSCLERFGLYWDETVTYQSHRTEFYQSALQHLQAQKQVYACNCTRKRIGYRPYDGHCRQRTDVPPPFASRVLTNDVPVCFDDGIQGRYCQSLHSDTGDFVIKRRDGLFAYQLAVVVDDAAQNISEIVRGADLLDNTPRQIYLQHLLNLPTPDYLHLPVAHNHLGHKLSKQTFAPAVDDCEPVPLLWRIMHLYGQQPPIELQKAALSTFWEWAFTYWNSCKIPRVTSLVLTDF